MIKQLVEKFLPEITNLRRLIHENPELSFKEFETTDLIYKTLEHTHIQLQKCSGGTGVIGLLEGGKPGKVLALRADIDALPIVEKTGLSFTSNKEGIMHACGHDIHTSVLLGAALILNDLKDELTGTIKFIFQPAEEVMGGAEFMITEGVLNQPEVDHIVCLHTWPFTDAGKVGIRSGAMMASANQFEIKVIGSGGHAAHPHKSVDPIPVAAKIVDALQQIVSRQVSPVESAVVTIGQIHGGTADNIIANEVHISGTVRTLHKDMRNFIENKIGKISRSIAEAFGAEVKFIFHEGTPPVINNASLVKLFSEAITDQMGDAVIEELKEPSLGGEDFAFYLEHVDGMLFRLGTGNDDENSRKGLHNPQIIFDERSLPTGMEAITAFATRYLK